MSLTVVFATLLVACSEGELRVDRELELGGAELKCRDLAYQMATDEHGWGGINDVPPVRSERATLGERETRVAGQGALIVWPNATIEGQNRHIKLEIYCFVDLFERQVLQVVGRDQYTNRRLRRFGLLGDEGSY
jgi:hypothetical protein